MIKAIVNFIKWESSAGIILVLMAILALVLCNTPWGTYYYHALETKFTISLGAYALSKPIILWINDGLMAIFFLLVGLEIKREIIEGELNSVKKAILPAIAALGGMLIPALIYSAFNADDSLAMRGWAIPSATDIAFSLGVISLLGSRVPIGLKVFLTAIAILDDLGAIVIIAFFYTVSLSWFCILGALCIIFILFVLNRCNVTRFFPYALLGIILWLFVLESGVHATLAGVILALFYPIRDIQHPNVSPLKKIEESLQPWITYGVLPLFAFANAGIPLTGVSLSILTESIPLGIICGLFFGKQIGIFLFTWLAAMLGIGEQPEGSTWFSLYGVALLCGIGFTMSLFIGTLAFGYTDVDHNVMLRLGVLVGSLISSLVGYSVLRWATSNKKSELSYES